jgi:predicted dehydrogenase
MSEKIKVGIWGLGRAGNSMQVGEIGRYPELFELVAGCDTSEERRQAMAAKCKCRLYSDPEKFLADPDIELISVATRSTEHAEHACRALEAGKYVFLEKPIALNQAEARKLAAADKRHPGRLFLRHNRHFEAPFTHIREIIASGVLGNVYEFKLYRHGYQRRKDWQTLIACGGGQLNNWGPHIIEHALCFLESPVAEIWSNLKRVAAVGDAEDHLKIILRGKNERIVDLEISGGTAIAQPEYIIFGTKGALTCHGNNIHLKYIDPAQKLAEIKPDPGNPSLSGGFANEEKINWIEQDIKAAPKSGSDTYCIWEHLHAAIRRNIPFPITLAHGLEVVRVTALVKKGTPFEKKLPAT